MGPSQPWTSQPGVCTRARNRGPIRLFDETKGVALCNIQVRSSGPENSLVAGAATPQRRIRPEPSEFRGDDRMALLLADQRSLRSRCPQRGNAIALLDTTALALPPLGPASSDDDRHRRTLRPNVT